MSYLKNADTNTLITRFVSLEEKQEVIRTAQTLLSGGVYIQRIGEPTDVSWFGLQDEEGDA